MRDIKHLLHVAWHKWLILWECCNEIPSLGWSELGRLLANVDKHRNTETIVCLLKMSIVHRITETRKYDRRTWYIGVTKYYEIELKRWRAKEVTQMVERLNTMGIHWSLDFHRGRFSFEGPKEVTLLHNLDLDEVE